MSHQPAEEKEVKKKRRKVRKVRDRSSPGECLAPCPGTVPSSSKHDTRMKTPSPKKRTQRGNRRSEERPRDGPSRVKLPVHANGIIVSLHLRGAVAACIRWLGGGSEQRRVVSLDLPIPYAHNVASSYMTTQQHPPFFSPSSPSPWLKPFIWPPVPGAPVYDDISLLYLRISRTMS